MRLHCLRIILHRVAHQPKTYSQSQNFNSNPICFLLSTEISQHSLQGNTQTLSTLALGASIGPLVVHKLWHMVGTKRIILASNMIMVVSWILALFR